MQAAMTLFRKNGYHKTTMREICNASKVNRASIYDYFKSKEDILVYIYKRMMRVGEADQGVRGHTISSWKELEPYIRLFISNSWIRHRNAIQLLYRESISLDQQTLREIMAIESDYVARLAENLRRSLGWTDINQELEIIANVLAFTTALIPMRGWNMKGVEQTKILDAVTDMFMMKLREMRKSTSESRRATPKRV